MLSRKGENCCIDVDDNLTSTKMNVHALIHKEVRMSSSQAMGLKKDATVYCNDINDTDSKAVGGPGDFYGGGLSKKHNSYDRYLARKKGKIEFYSGRKDRLSGFTMLGSNAYLC
tara:strand:+ start:73 stop:414 length:342 start_codon:yes stop_codon:yes gene_type:complete